MERKGLVRRQSVAQDARLKKIVLTERAWAVSEVMKEDAAKLECTLIRGFTKEEVKTLISYIERMKENISGPQEIG